MKNIFKKLRYFFADKTVNAEERESSISYLNSLSEYAYIQCDYFGQDNSTSCALGHLFRRRFGICSNNDLYRFFVKKNFCTVDDYAKFPGVLGTPKLFTLTKRNWQEADLYFRRKLGFTLQELFRIERWNDRAIISAKASVIQGISDL